MNLNLPARWLLGCVLSSIPFSSAVSQTAPVTSDKTPPPTPTLPFTTQLKKTVGFITTYCLHQPTADELAKMTPEAKALLAPDAREEWERELAANLTPEELSKMTIEQKGKVRVDTHSGTGFLVTVPEPRIGKDDSFEYFVTNKHVSQPGIEDGKVCDVLGYSITFNHHGDTIHMQTESVAANVTWYYSSDLAVDIAVLPVSLTLSDWDIEFIPVSLFVTPEMVRGNEIAEGDPVTFAGLFVQYTGSRKVEPIVRSGSIAMLPDDPIPATLKRPAHVYLADAHAFSGNSGSPMFVDINKFKTGIGYDYRLLGVVAGEVHEQNDFTLQITASINGSVNENSDISVVVPAAEVRTILESDTVKKLRDDYVAAKQSKK